MPVRIAIPEPTSSDADYNGRCLPAYEEALLSSGAISVRIGLSEPREKVIRLLSTVAGVLLPGSRFDVDPQKYGANQIPECGEADPGRAAVDELLLQDAFDHGKPVLAICHGAQTLNVWRKGTLIQDLESELGSPVDHQPGRGVAEAHSIKVTPGTRLAGLLPPDFGNEAQVNSSHHQAIRTPGDHLLVSALSPIDGVIEAVELEDADHFAVGVQWHPERTFDRCALSRALFGAFVEAASRWAPGRVRAPGTRS